jgi:hypothetical protein
VALEFHVNQLFFFNFHGFAKIHHPWICLNQIQVAEKTSFKFDCQPTLHPPALWAELGSRLADARKHRRWHLTSYETMSSFKTDGSECQGDCTEIRRPFFDTFS